MFAVTSPSHVKLDILAAVRGRLLRKLRRSFVLLTAAAVTGIAVLAVGAAGRHISTGALAVYLGALLGLLAGGRWGQESFAVEFAGLPALSAEDRIRARVGEAAPLVDVATIPPGPPRIRLESVSFAYPNAGRPVLHDLDLEIRPGELLAMVGVNGAGKTTLIKLLTGMYRPTSGRILVDNLKIQLDQQIRRSQV